MRKKKMGAWLLIASLVIMVFVFFYLRHKLKPNVVQIDPIQVKVSEIIEFVKTIQTNEVSSKLDKTVLTTAISGGPVILLDIDHIPNGWKNTLQVILERSRITARYPVKIDLRYQSPILTYGQE